MAKHTHLVLDLDCCEPTGIALPAEGGGTGSGITEAEHELLDTLVHDLSENYVEDIIRSFGRVSQIIVWETSARTKKVREAVVTRATCGKVSNVLESHYNSTGALKYTLNYSISRTNGKISLITTTKASY